VDRDRLTRAGAVALAAVSLLGAAGEAVAAEIVFSRAGRRNHHILVTDDGGRDFRRIASELQAFAPVWSPDRSRIAYWSSRTLDAGFEQVTVVSRSGRRKRRVTGPGWGPPSWSPDGRWIAAACARLGPCERRAGLYLIDSDRPARKRRVRGTQYTEFAAWAPGGRRLVLVGSSKGRDELYVKRLGRPRLRRLTRSDVDEAGPDWSPDGRWIAYARPPRAPQQPYDIWLVRADGDRHVRLTSTRANETNPAWSPSGRRILFRSNLGLFTIRPDGTRRRKIAGTTRRECCPDW
jgi:Tol biopolymer transport system component